MLSDKHREMLRAAAITDAVIDTCGAKTISTPDASGISFLYQGEKRESRQFRPDSPAEGAPKYLFPKGEKNFVNILRNEKDAPLLIVEGTKQALAAASHTYWSVIGLAGCTMWHRHDWSTVKGREVVVCFDGDAATNRDVYMQAAKFGAELKEERAKSVKFVQIPDGMGLDDYLAEEDEEDRRPALARLVRRAEAKPADAVPRPKKNKETGELPPAYIPDTGGRQMVAVNGDLKEVVDNIVSALKNRWDGHHLFNYGRAITCVEGPSTLPLEDGLFLRLLADTVYLVNHRPATERSPERFIPGGRPDTQTIKAVLSSFGEFSDLTRVVRAPFVRPDGTVCTKAGYDAETATILVPDADVTGISVPENPSQDKVSDAVSLLMDDWLADMPFPTPGDRANALALLVTPFVRGMFPLAPMAVVNGLQMGVGKNLFADCVALLATGQPAVPMPYTRDEEETRKQITSAFRSGTELFAFDEAHVIEGASLARALTSITYTDRILGASHMAEFPNQVTWMAMGNQVQVNGDCSRRVYWIELRPKGANPQDRDVSVFRHPDLRGWTSQNRARLVTAILTLIRSWFVAGKPSSPRGTSLGSFEGWDKTVGGIVAHAGLKGFLGEIQVKRSETDFDGAFWTAHIEWLHETFGTDNFTTADVRREAVNSKQTYEAPPGMLEASDPNFTRELGKRYSQKNGRWFGTLRLVKGGMGHRSTMKWRIEDAEDGGNGGSAPTPHIASEKRVVCTEIVNTGVCTDAYIHVLRDTYKERGGDEPSTTLQPSTTAFDIETASADQLHRRSDFFRLGATNDGRVSVTTDPSELIDRLNRADRIVGHNILGFDLIALAKWHGADYEALASKCRDTFLIERHKNPVAAKGMQPRGYYGLDQTAARYGQEGKSDNLPRLAKKHGGFDKIPLDDPEYVGYLEGDVRASHALFSAMEGVDDPYILREHQVQTIMGRITLEGFRVDEELVWDRYQYGQDKLDGIRDTLHSRYGLPNDSKLPHRTTAGKKAVYEALKGAGIGPVWLERNWEKAKDGSLLMGKEVLQEKIKLFREHGKDDAAGVCEAILAMNGVRSVYGTVIDYTINGRVHPQISADQSSGRWSITEPGLTVMGKRGGKHTEREIFLPEPGHLLVAFDLDQVDMRAIAGLCQDPAYMAMFEPGRDVHSEVASMVGLAREDAKQIGHGWNYGMTVGGQVKKGVAEEKARQFDEGMREAFPRLCAWKEEIREEAGMLPYDFVPDADDSYRILHNGYGRPMRVERSRAYTQAAALMGQGTTRDILAEGLLRMPFEVRKLVKAVVHDEVVISIPADSIEDVSRVVKDALTFEFKGVPITCGSSKPGKSWGDCYSK